jgi:hypothetical protein
VFDYKSEGYGTAGVYVDIIHTAGHILAMHHWSFKSYSRFDLILIFNFESSGNVLIDYRSLRSLGSPFPSVLQTCPHRS